MSYSALDKAKYKGEVLDQIMAHKRDEVARQISVAPLSQVKAFARLAPPPLDFEAAITAGEGVNLIAEVKRASPSRGLIAQEWDPVLIGETYARNGVAAISCLTDSRFFQGQLEYLAAIKERLRAIGMDVPVLRKDFFFHEYQVYEARMAGADAILLIVAALSDNELKRLYSLSTELDMHALVEVHDEEELDRALALRPRIVGVNNRNLKTFAVDLETTGRLRQRIPPDVAIVAESGIRSGDDVRRLAVMGCRAVLVGETLCRLPQSERASAVRSFISAGRRPA